MRAGETRNSLNACLYKCLFMSFGCFSLFCNNRILYREREGEKGRGGREEGKERGGRREGVSEGERERPRGGRETEIEENRGSEIMGLYFVLIFIRHKLQIKK